MSEQPIVEEAAKTEEFSSAFAEFSAAKDGDLPEETKPVDHGADLDLKEDDEQDKDEKEVDKVKEVEGDGDEADKKPDEDDLQTKYESLKESKVKLEQVVNSNHGRVSGLQKKINDLEAELANPTKATKSGAAEALADGNVSWDDFKKDYPDIAKAMDARFYEVEENTNTKIDTQIQTAVKPLEAAASRTNQEIVIEALTTPTEDGGYGHTDFVEVVKSPSFNSWLAVQPQSTQDLTSSENVEDAAALVDSFKKSRAAFGADPSNEEKKDPAPEGDVAAIEAKRAKQLKSGTTDIPSKPAEVAKEKGGANEFSAAFKLFSKKKEKERLRI